MSAGAARYSVQNVDLSELVSEEGVYTTLMLGPCRSCEGRARLALDEIVTPPPHSGLILAAVADHSEVSQVIVATPSDAVHRFTIDEPLHADIARRGSSPSLGVLIEAAQTTVPHVSVVVDDDVFAITAFGLVSSETSTVGPMIKESVVHAIDAIARLQPWLVFLVGPESVVTDFEPMFRKALPSSRFEIMTEEASTDLMTVADDIVRHASSMAATWVTDELRHLKAAAEKDYTVAGPDVLAAIETGSARRVFVHDDPTDTRSHEQTRLVDEVVARTISKGLALVMIPNAAGLSDTITAIAPPPGQ